MEETKEEPQEDQPITEKLPIRELKDIIDEKWIKVPLQTAMRALFQKSGYYMSNTHKYGNKEYIPRLIWLNLDWPLSKVY